MSAMDERETWMDADDPDVAFLTGSDEVKLRHLSVKEKMRRNSGIIRGNKTALICSPRSWTILLCLLVAILILTLAILLYRKSESLSTLSRGNETEIAFMQSTNHDSSSESVVRNLTQCLYKMTRLPQTARPLHYDLHLQPDSQLRNYTGSVSIQLAILHASSVVVLHAKNLDILTVSLVESDGYQEDTLANVAAVEPDMNLVSRTQICTANDQLQLVTRKLLKVEKKYMLRIEFGGRLLQSMHGFYVSSYLGPDGINRTLATTQFEDTHARSAFPCFDEPAMKATFRLRLQRDAHLIALSNSKVKKSEVDATNGRVTDEFETTVAMSTYLLAFVICDFDKRTVYTQGPRRLEINGYAVRNKLDQLDFALQVAAKVVVFYEKFFAVDYPLKKLDLIAIPDFAAGAMENWGLITFRESTLLFDAAESSLTHKELVAYVVSHEIAHQWFGNLVTMTWWDQLWLNEGFATFMEYLGSNASEPSLAGWEQFTVYAVQPALFKDTLLKTHPVVADVEDAADITSRFDDISYLKGASILRMLYDALTPTVFTQGVANYLAAHKFSNARTSDLWNALNEAWIVGKPAGLTVESIANSWTNQPGYPIISPQLSHSTLTISQRKMVAMNEVDVLKDARWIVPVSILTSDGNSHMAWLRDGSMDVQLKSTSLKWFKLNVRQTGFYRVNYQADNWNALADYLKSGSIEGGLLAPEDRANLLDDAFSLSRAGKLNVSVALNLGSYLSGEMHFLPWVSTRAHLEGMENLLFDSDSFGHFRKWRSRNAGAVFTRVNCIHEIGLPSSPSRRLCIQIFEEACESGFQLCREQARDIFSQLRKQNKSVPTDIRRTIYRTAIKYGDEDDWDFLWQRYQSTQVASEKNLILGALTNTRDIWLIEKLVRSSLDSRLVRPSDTVTVWVSLSMNYQARQTIWKAIRHHWDLLYTRYGEDTAIASVFVAVHWMSQKEDLADLRAFFEQPGRKLGAGALAYEQAVETIRLRREFLELAEADISAWLRRQVSV